MDNIRPPLGTSSSTELRPLGGRETILKKGNREVIADHYFSGDISEQNQFKYKVFVRLGALRGTKFTATSFEQCIFDSCYVNGCVFDSCSFVGCRFVSCNFHQTAFKGCDFRYATFERTQIDDDVLSSDPPREENLRMRFARSLRMNYSQIGDAKAVNKAVLLELTALGMYLRKSWSSSETYYSDKYGGFRRVAQFFRWLEFAALDAVWGNGESIVKLFRSIFLFILAIAIHNAFDSNNPSDILEYWRNLKMAPAIYLGAIPPSDEIWFAATVAAGRYIGVALFTALLVKRFSRR